MNVDQIKQLIDLAQEAGLAELEVADGVGAERRRIRIVCARSPAPAPSAEPPPSRPARGEVLPAPLTGTFFRSPAPGEAPFVEVGQEVAVGDVLCIIESMKMMNKVESDRAGSVAEVLVENGRPVETGTALFHIV